MRKIIKSMSYCLVVALSFISCETEDFDELDDVRDLGGYAHLVHTRISQFDTNSDLTINLFTAEGVTVETVEILQDGAVIGTATVSGETATFNSSILGDIEPGDSFPVRIRATLSNGNVAVQPFTITTVNSLTPSADNPEELTLSDLSDAEIFFSTFTVGATVDNIEMHIKEGAQGTYIDSGVNDFQCTAAGLCSFTLGETNIDDLNLSVNDTLYYRVIADSGELSQTIEEFIVIVEEEDEDED